MVWRVTEAPSRMEQRPLCCYCSTGSEVYKGYKGHKDGLQPETLADGNWLVRQNHPVSKIEIKSDTNLRSLYES